MSPRRSATSVIGAAPTPGGAAGSRREVSIQRLLDVDPDLGRLLSDERYADAREELRVRVHVRERGAWRIKALPARVVARHLGVLVIDGVIASDIALGNVVSTELVGAGDVVRPWALDASERLLDVDPRWVALTVCRVAVLEPQFAAALARYPEIYTVLLERADHRARRLAAAQAIAELTRVDQRLLNAFWHLAERWGRVTSEGVLVPLDISHRLLGQLVGARRPTVSTALAQLTRTDAIRRRADGAWILLGDPPSGPTDLKSVVSRRGLLVERRPSALRADANLARDPRHGGA